MEQNEDRAMSWYVCVISDPQEFTFLSHGTEHADAQSIRANDKRYSGESNENDLRESSCDWLTLIAHSGNSAPWNIRKYILAERNQRNEARTNHERSANSAPWDRILRVRSYGKRNCGYMELWNVRDWSWLHFVDSVIFCCTNLLAAAQTFA